MTEYAISQRRVYQTALLSAHSIVIAVEWISKDINEHMVFECEPWADFLWNHIKSAFLGNYSSYHEQKNSNNLHNVPQYAWFRCKFFFYFLSMLKINEFRLKRKKEHQTYIFALSTNILGLTKNPNVATHTKSKQMINDLLLQSEQM